MSALVDLRSDTVTRPSAAMRQAMAQAEVGDDVYGEDPSINALESEVAALFGKQAGLFVPTGSLGNQLALRLLAKPGQEIVCDVRAHIARAELGAAAAFSGITFRTWQSELGLVDVEQIAEIITPNAGPYFVSTTAIAVENTHNFGGGTVQPADQVAKLAELARAHGIALHLDGARIWNAHVATGTSLAELAAPFDTISVCLSKGLGAPVGSVLVSTVEHIADARIWRKRYGAGMRQAGILAEAGRFAIANNITRLADDHARAKRLGIALGVEAEQVPTNIVVLRVADSAALAAKAKEQGVLVSTMSPTIVRLVTHLDIDDSGIDRATEVLTPLVG
jgi:threonine aldolase